MSIQDDNLALVESLMKSIGVRISTTVSDNTNDCLRFTLRDRSTLTIDGTDEPLTPHHLQTIAELLIADRVAQPLRSSPRHSVTSTGLAAPKIMRPPGSYLVVFAQFVFSKKKCENVLFPSIADMREEYFEALSEHDVWKSRRVLFRGHWSFWAAVGWDLPVSAIRLVKKIWTAAS